MTSNPIQATKARRHTPFRTPRPPYAAGGALNYHSPTLAQVHFAGFWIRFVAAIVDGLILAVPSSLMDLVFTGSLLPDDTTPRTPGSIIVQPIIELIIGWLYEAMFTASSYQGTPGKLAVGIRVTDVYGNTISFGRATGRHFAKIISAVIFLIGYIMAAFDAKKRALHDQIAGTLVSYKNR